jgi:hypothetical protein
MGQLLDGAGIGNSTWIVHVIFPKAKLNVVGM